MPESALRIFLYHRVTDDRDPLALSPAKFRAQMEVPEGERLPRAGCRDRARSALRGELERRTVALTFDDGFRDVLDNAQPALAELGFSATVFVSTAVIDGEATYSWAAPDAATPSWEQIRRSDASGVLRFEPHSRTHPDLRRLGDAEVREEITGRRPSSSERPGVRPSILLPGRLLRLARVRAGSGGGVALRSNL